MTCHITKWHIDFKRDMSATVVLETLRRWQDNQKRYNNRKKFIEDHGASQVNQTAFGCLRTVYQNKQTRRADLAAIDPNAHLPRKADIACAEGAEEKSKQVVSINRSGSTSGKAFEVSLFKCSRDAKTLMKDLGYSIKPLGQCGIVVMDPECEVDVESAIVSYLLSMLRGAGLF